MAQHFPIIEWINEKWFPEMVTEHKPDEKNFSMLIDNKTENWNPLKVCECNFEIHINEKNEIREVYVPL